MTVLRALVESRGSAEDPHRPLTDSTLLGVIGGEPTEAGVPVTNENAYRMTAVYRAIAIHAGVIGALPWHAFRRQAKERTRVGGTVVDDPHFDKTPFEVKEWIGQSLLSWGDSFNLKQRDGLGRVREIEPLHPQNVHVERRREWMTDANPSGKRFEVRDGATSRTYSPHQILHIPGLSYDGVQGMSPIQLARQGISLSMAAERFGARLFSRGALIDGVLQTDEQLGPDGVKKVQADWAKKVRGQSNWYEVPVLDGGLKYERMGLPPADAQFLETRRFGVQEVARMFGLPPHLLGDVERSTSWGSGIEQQMMQMLVFTTDPWLVRIEQRASKELVLDRSWYVRFERKALLRPDTAARFMAYQRAIQNGWMNADEIRAAEDLDPIPDGKGQVFYHPSNIEPVEAVE